MDDVQMIAVSASMRAAWRAVGRVAPTDCAVLIMGESGTGKELVARELHRLSRRAAGPFVVVNCGAIPEGLMESELFGYEGGAFTGASRHGKPGLFAEADGGTLFLDEIAELPVTLQVKLLRVLQDFTITRVGGVKPYRVDVRVLAATNQSLLRLAKHGRFRPDLFYRLNAVTIHVPPLRERPEDLEAAIHAFLDHYNRKYGHQRRLTPELAGALRRYHWPGNIRQLRHLIERLVVLSEGDELRPEHLPGHVRLGLAEGAGAGRGVAGVAAPGYAGTEDASGYVGTDARPGPVLVRGLVPLADAVAETERQLLALAVDRYRSTRGVARVLGISQSAAVRKLKRYGLQTRTEPDSH